MLTPRIAKLTLIGLTALALTGCATHYDPRTNNTLMGAGLGAAAGAVVSQGNPWYTLGGATAGGLLGNILTKDNDRRPRQWSNNRQSRHYTNGRQYRPSSIRHHRHRQ